MSAIVEVQRKKVRRKPRRELHEHLGLSLSPGQVGEFIQVFVYEIEHYDSQKALEIVDSKCAKAEGFNAFVLGGVLNVINRNDWYREYGFSSFEDMVSKKIGQPASVAQEYMKLYEVLSDKGIPWKKIRHLRWTQIKWYGKHLTPDNADEWVAAVETAGDEFQADFAMARITH